MTPAPDDATTRFGDQLAALFDAAGSPTLETVSRGAAKLAPGRSKASVQRISDWRRGRHLPASFDSLEPVITWLILRAQMRNPDHPVPPLPRWRQWWSSAREDGSAAIPPPGPPVEQPYAGLAPMTAEQRDVFFGRDEVLADLAGLIADAAGQDSLRDRIVVVTGVSGAGKSSLLGAGLARLTADRAAGGRWRVDRRFAVELVDETDEPGETGETGDSAEDQPGVAIHVVDQCEGLLVGGGYDAAQVDAAVAQILALAAAPGGVVVLGIRADMYERAAEIDVLAHAWQRRSLIVGAMTEDQLADVIAKPAKLAGLRVEPGLAARMIADLRVASFSDAENRAGQLPLLAHVLAELARQRRGESLTLAGYRAIGGVGSAIAATAEDAYTGLSDADRPVADRLLLALVHVAADRIVVRVRLDPLSIAAVDPDHDALTRVVEQLAAARLLTVSSTGIILIHDAVLTQWPRLVELIERSRVLKPVLQRISVDAGEWEGSGRDDAQLYDEARYHRSAIVADDPLLPARARTFLTASGEHLERVTRRRRMRQTATALLAVAALIAAVVAIGGNVALGHQRDDARFAELLSTAEQTRATDPGLAAQLSVAAWRLRPDDPAARFGVLRTQDLPLPRTGEELHGGSIYDLVVARSRGLVATASYDRTVRLWHAPDLRPYPTPLYAGAYVTSVAFTPDGQRLAMAAGDGSVTVYDVADPARPTLLNRLAVPANAGTAYILTFNRDGSVLATSHDNGTVALWDARRGFAPLGSADGGSGPVRSVAFSPTAPVLTAATTGGTVLVVDVADTRAPRVVAKLGDGRDIGWHSVAVSPDGRLLAGGRDNGTIGIWDLADPAAPGAVGFTIAAHPDAIWSLDFSADGKTLISGGLDGAARRWAVGDVLDPRMQRQPLQQIGREMRSGRGGIMAADFLADGTLLTAGGPRSISAWDLPASPMPGHRSPIRRPAADAAGSVVVTAGALRMIVWRIEHGLPSLASTILLPGNRSARDVSVSPDGRLLAAAADGGGAVFVYDIAAREAPTLVATLPVRTRHLGLVAFAPRGSVLAAADTDSSMRLWSLADPASPRQLGALNGSDGFVQTVAFSPDGTTIVVGSADWRAYRWSITDPAHPVGPVVESAHQGMVLSAEFSADGHYLYTGSDDSTLVVRRIDGTSSTVVSRIGRPSRVTSLSRSADGRWLAAGTDRGTELWSLGNPAQPRLEGVGFGGHSDALLMRTVAFGGSSQVFVGGHQLLSWWLIDVDQQARRVCSATGGGLTKTQWRSAAHSLPFRGVCA
ncbi:AAA family ATPase [Gordonia crocea]|uniref:Novel STAND NTPase 1 domain-containing protein n=1 Tax=Gordonia crocea TaxID=589162 RepID=A0A7I9V262_9ACTN|nr:AAA family ATPase [Gordonia crocea]GED99296.1 hypothetical protein nbrc107697_33350 [Gordonia crocea]